MRKLPSPTITCSLFIVIVLIATVCTPAIGAAAATTTSASGSESIPKPPSASDGHRIVDNTRLESTPVTTSKRVQVGGWSQAQYKQPAGDIVTVSLNLSATVNTTAGNIANQTSTRSHAYVQLGSVSAGFIDVLRVEDADGDGEVSFSINTRTLGTSNSISATASDIVYHSDGDIVHSGVHGRLSTADNSPTFVGPDGSELSDFDAYLAALGLINSASEHGIDQLQRPLQPGKYRISASTAGGFRAEYPDTQPSAEDGSEDLRAKPTTSIIGEATIELRKPGLGNVSVQTAPAGPADTAPNQTALVHSITETRSVTSTDRLVITAEATGIYGHLVAIEGDFASLSTGFDPGTLSQLEGRTGEGIGFAVKSNDGPVLQGPGSSEGVESLLEVLDLSTADATEVSVYANNTAGKLYVVIDPRSIDGFTLDNDSRQQFSASLSYTSPSTAPFLFDREDQHIQSYHRGLVGGAGGDIDTPAFPYFEPGENDTKTVQFSLVKPRVEFKGNDGWARSDTSITVNRGSPTRIQGKTNVAPGTEGVLQVKFQEGDSSFAFLQQSTVTVAPDGTFSGTFDLPEVTTNETTTLSLLVADTEIAHTEMTVVSPKHSQTAQSTQTAVVSVESDTSMGESDGSTPGFTPLVAVLALIVVFTLVFVSQREK